MSAPLSQATIHHFRHALPQPIATVMGPMTHRPALLLRLEDAEGAHGWGEIWCNFPPDGDYHRARLATRILPAALAGMTAETPDAFAQILRRLHRLILQCGEPGPVAQIACAADIALHDLRARRAGVSISQMLGGTVSAVPAYASGISPDKAPEQIERMRTLGYRQFKQRIGFGPDDGIGAAEDTEQSLQEGETLMLDANQAWDLASALSQSKRLANMNLVWLEEPLSADASDDDWLSLARAASMPLAGGENLTGGAFDRAIALGALGVIQPDICKWGGLSTTYKVARAAVAAGRRYCPHFLGGGVGLAASAHLLAAIGGDGVLEVDSSENPFIPVFSGRGLALEDGLFPISTGPGLGFDPDVDALKDLLTARLEVTL
uniref:mandelate racemase/muconate lactonizing enzyme family protein n=1 Tax=Pararhizobium sp. IMCC3301 TaxID=3067904 RepID=UPI0027426817|nr:mandelate racemase/muconate lactonizing enzyme family protein [Pararhizobium sp. IMCC3301]